MNETLLTIVFIVVYIALLSLCIMKLINSNNNKKEIKMILAISTIVFIIGIILYANNVTPHEWVKYLNTSGLDDDLQLKEYIEANKGLTNLKYYGGIILIIISYIGNIMAIVKSNEKATKDNTKIID
jgi:predicted permease